MKHEACRAQRAGGSILRNDPRYTRIIRLNFKEDYAMELPDRTSAMSIRWEGSLLGCLWLKHSHFIGLTDPVKQALSRPSYRVQELGKR
jgi:hypothetical protein